MASLNQPQGPSSDSTHEEMVPLNQPQGPSSGLGNHFTKLVEKEKDEHPFVLDFIAGKCELQTIQKVYMSLGENTNADMDKIKKSYPNNPHEQKFQMLCQWYRNCESEKPYSVLEKALIENGRKDLMEEGFDKELFTDKEELDDEVMKDVDILYIAHNIIGVNYRSFVRFLGLKESVIDIIAKDNIDSVEQQAINMIEKCVNNRLITRKKLFAALNYVKAKDLIIKLKQKTETSSV